SSRSCSFIGQIRSKSLSSIRECFHSPCIRSSICFASVSIFVPNLSSQTDCTCHFLSLSVHLLYTLKYFTYYESQNSNFTGRSKISKESVTDRGFRVTKTMKTITTKGFWRRNGEKNREHPA